MYGAFKFIHVLGVVLLLGNVTASAVWKVFANRTRDGKVIAFAQKLVTYTDWSLTLGGVWFVVIGGYGMVYVARLNPWEGWLLWGQGLFIGSGLIWLLKLIPLQVAQAKAAAAFSAGGAVDSEYWRLCRQWIFWGAVATVPLVIATYLMIAKT